MWQLGILRDDGVPIGLSLHECMLMAAVFSAADEVATLSLIKQVRVSLIKQVRWIPLLPHSRVQHTLH